MAYTFGRGTVDDVVDLARQRVVFQRGQDVIIDDEPALTAELVDYFESQLDSGVIAFLARDEATRQVATARDLHLARLELAATRSGLELYERLGFTVEHTGHVPMELALSDQ